MSISTSSYQLVLWDFMGTVADPREPVEQTYHRWAESFAIVVDPTEILNRLQQSFARAEPLAFGFLPPKKRREVTRQWWRQRAADALGLPVGELPEALFLKLWTHFGKAENWVPRPSALEKMAEVDGAGGRNAILSNNDARLFAVVEGLGLRMVPADIIVSEELLAAKPDPAAFRAALALLGMEVGGDVLYIDDQASNRAAAERLGLATATPDEPI